MGSPVAKEGDQVVGLDTHVIMVSSPGGPVPTPMPHPFSGAVRRDGNTTVFVDNERAAVVGSNADCLPPHIPMGGPFQKPPANAGTISQGSSTVFIDGAQTARAGDPVRCCNDPADQKTGHVIAISSVFAS